MTLAMFGWIALFGGLLLALAAETLWPRYEWSQVTRARHFFGNMLLWLVIAATLSVLAQHVLSPMFGVADAMNLGLLRAANAPVWLAATLGFLLADFSDYVFHRASHRFRALWLLHAVHHSDLRLDASTSLRQHPLSYVPALVIRLMLIMSLGAPAWSLVLRDVLAVISSHLHHAAVAWSPRISAWAERYLSWLIIPPTAHWLHHDPREELTNSNYGQLLSCWDHMFGTYVPSTTATSESGLSALSDARWQTVRGLLLTPWWARRLPKL
ncbi:MAG: sterol desaturase family protein [Casimicrobium sp.]|jgi:sterol desaturase/sphingolipid hydroxylase (fatty acid hydroxylase superfamily)